MATAKFAAIGGKWVEMPLVVHQAKEMGWFHGVDFVSPLYGDESNYTNISKWCEQILGRGSCRYLMFQTSVWFYQESDATMCKLRWL
jgi:hypothetical protein